MDTTKKVSFPIRMDEELKNKLDKAAELTGLSLQDISRLCLQIGLADLRRVNFDLATAIATQAHASALEPPSPTTPKVVNYQDILKASSQTESKVAEPEPPPKSARSK